MATASSRWRVRSIESNLARRLKPGAHGKSREDFEQVELRTITLTPVIANVPANAQNLRMWHDVPGGQIRLDGVAPEVWSMFEPGKEYKVNFTPAE